MTRVVAQALHRRSTIVGNDDAISGSRMELFNGPRTGRVGDGELRRQHHTRERAELSELGLMARLLGPTKSPMLPGVLLVREYRGRPFLRGEVAGL